MKKIKFNTETGNVLIETDNGYQALTQLHQNTEYTDYTKFYRINDRIYV
jgi:hypothetical protein